MDMTPQTAWLLAISAVVIVGVIAFFVGRSSAGTKGRIDELEAELARKSEEAERYRKEVDAHFDKTATLFVSMAGSYKELFEHLSAGYDKLSGASARERFQERVDALLPRRVVEPAASGALLAGAATADEIPYGITDWPEPGHGNHRAVLRVTDSATAVRARLAAPL